MKKRALPLLLCLAMIFSLSVPAMAADQTTASTTVTKTVTDPPASSGGDSGSSDDEPVNVSSYEVSIPASFSMDDGDYFTIGATKNEIGERQELRVFVDYDRTFDADGYFYLKNTANVAQKLPCTISVGTAGYDYWQTITSANTCVVATFTHSSGLKADYCGSAKIVTAGSPCTAGSSSVAGTYSGTVYFKIELVDF